MTTKPKEAAGRPQSQVGAPSLREALADLEHARWARWQAYLHSLCVPNPDGSLTMPADCAVRWARQIGTPYAALSEREKDSDRKEADNTIAVVRRYCIITGGAP